ncbi:potassium channel family protein [Amycolatopsis sp.]|uniref:potassium channel family protein n=1 Tax=Amycolatopsis sp. TaxID=37632 RepID=UPI002C84829D|nr:potassium channel family protein [Amycolatopsis sp.]HVV14534.1 potassium channel family protein [Amycolatopsis sp.]
MSGAAGETGGTAAPVARAAVRAVLTVAILVTVYYVLPLAPSPAGGALILLIGGLVAVVFVVVWEVRAILRAPYPLLQGVQALALVIPLFLLVFAGAYYFLESTNPGSFSLALTRTDSLYFVVTTFATVGFGDIVAVSTAARVLVTFQMIGDLLVLGLVLRLILVAVQRGRARPKESPAVDDAHSRSR